MTEYRRIIRLELPKQVPTEESLRNKIKDYVLFWEEFLSSEINYQLSYNRFLCVENYRINLFKSNIKTFFNEYSKISKKENWYQTDLPEFYIDLEVLISTEYIDTKNEKFPSQSFLDIRNSSFDLIIKTFLQDLFIAFNISLPFSLHISTIKIDGKPINENYSSILYSDLIFLYWDKAKKDNWPVLSKLKFNQTWEWLRKVGFLGNPTAKTPIQKSLNILLDLSSQGTSRVFDLILIAQAFENLLKADYSRGIKSTIESRILKILGEPKKNKKWLSEFYSFRSKAAHGALPLNRSEVGLIFNEPFIFENFDPNHDIFLKTEKAASVLLALIQNLIINNAEEFTFNEKFGYKELDSVP